MSGISMQTATVQTNGSLYDNFSETPCAYLLPVQMHWVCTAPCLESSRCGATQVDKNDPVGQTIQEHLSLRNA
jgi:hypothetical protein